MDLWTSTVDWKSEMKCCADLFDTEDLEVGSAGQGQDVQSVSDKWQLSFQAQLLRLPAFDLNSELLYLNLFYEEYFRKHIFVQLLANEITYFFNMEQNQEDQGESFRWSLHFSAFCTFLSFWWQLSLPLKETFKKSFHSFIFKWNQFCRISAMTLGLGANLMARSASSNSLSNMPYEVGFWKMAEFWTGIDFLLFHFSPWRWWKLSKWKISADQRFSK